MHIPFVPSPHYNYRPSGTKIWICLLHASANSTLSGLDSWFQNPNSQVSAHYGIGKDGQIHQYVQDHHRAWHAGTSEWKTSNNVNDVSIGIELVNLNDGVDPYPQEQIMASVMLVDKIITTYGIQLDDIIAHYDCSPGRKTDPRGYRFDLLRQVLFEVRKC